MLVNSDTPVCLVFGVNGQDGSYLAERLLIEGYRVVGVGRQITSRWLSQSCDNFTYYQCDLCKVDSVVDLIEKFSPDYIYHAAAIHGSSGFNYEAVWHSAHAVNSLTTNAVL
jgi:GDPmannose 4,6-dehydratase